MKRLFLAIVFAASVCSMLANLNGNGYYRVRNYGSQRWAFIQDNKGSVDNVAGTADVHALGLIKNTEKIITDPASVVYISAENGSTYNMAAQGISLASLVGYGVNIRQAGTAENGQAFYYIYGTKSGVTKYIGDDKVNSSEVGLATTEPSDYPAYVKWKQWMILPIAEDSDNFFGVVPSVTAKGKSYSMLYASFPFKPYSSGLKTYYIGRVMPGMVEMIEINGDVPGGLPVIVQCAGDEAADNKLSLLTSSASAPATALTGVYYNYKSSYNTNQVVYDPETMRVLGTTSDGSLGFIKADNLETIPANSAYLRVPAGSPAEYKCVDPDTFTAGVETVSQDGTVLSFSNGVVSCSKPGEILTFNMSGHVVAKGSGTSLNLSHLPKGVYIVKAVGNSLKVMVN